MSDVAVRHRGREIPHLDEVGRGAMISCLKRVRWRTTNRHLLSDEDEFFKKRVALIDDGQPAEQDHLVFCSLLHYLETSTSLPHQLPVLCLTRAILSNM